MIKTLLILLSVFLFNARKGAVEPSTTGWQVDSAGIFEIGVDNPSPDILPSLKVNRPGNHPQCVWIAMTFPKVPGLICDAWCFEGEWTFNDARALDGGRLEFRHRMNQRPEIMHVTTMTLESGAVEFSGRIEIDQPGDTVEDLNVTEVPNICFQLIRAPGFQSAAKDYPRCSPVAEHAKNFYENYVSNCFIFTDDGMTSLAKTHRTDTSKDHNFPQDDPRNTPPAVQRYYGVWSKVAEGEGTSSLTRYVLPVIGAVSRDGKHLVAGVSDSARFVSQAWYDCFHFYPEWAPADRPLTERAWKLKIYAMENNPDALTARMIKDFPTIAKLKDNRVPLHE